MEPSLSVDERLKAAAANGDIDMLYTLIREDPYVLDHFERIPFVDTPLHSAASVGHADFAREIMMLKPSFARKLNEDGFTPLHLALLKGQTKMVDRLLDADSDLVRVQGKKGKTPFHYAAEQGNIHLLKRFLLSCPPSIQDVTNRSETALHIAVEGRKFDVFFLLVERLRTSMDKGSKILEYKTLNQKNDLGDTALHIAVKTHQPEVVKVLIENQVKLHVKNSKGLSALEILELGDTQADNREADRQAMKKMLLRAEASKSLSFFWWKSSKSSISPPRRISTSLTNVTVNLNTIENEASNVSPPLTSTAHSALNNELNVALERQPQGNNITDNKLFLKVRYILERWAIDLSRGRNNLSEDSRNMMLVALVLIATVGYQGVLSPPGGFRQDGNNNSTARTRDNKTSSQIRPPGTVMMGDWSFLFFMMFNSLALALTAHAIAFLVLPYQGEPRWWLYTRNSLAAFTALCYLIALQTISPNALLFALVIVIAAMVFLLIPFTYGGIKRSIERRNRKWCVEIGSG